MSNGKETNGVWTSSSVEESQPAPGVRIFKLTQDKHRVLVMDDVDLLQTAASNHLRECYSETWFGSVSSAWHPISPFTTDSERRIAPNAFSCLYGRTKAEELLSELQADAVLHTAMGLAFNVSSASCTHRELYSTGLESHVFRWARAWVLALHDNLRPDVFHSDGCDNDERPVGTDFFTVLAYPNSQWEAGWGGELLVAPRACNSSMSNTRQREEAAFATTTAALRVLPRARRLIVFSGELMHRSTPPTSAAWLTQTLPALTSAHATNPRERWRYASVMQVVCEQGLHHRPPQSQQHLLFGSVSLLLAALGLLLIVCLLRRRSSSSKVSNAKLPSRCH